MFRIVKVTGESLSPFYQEGDYVVITTIPFLLRRLKPGATIVFSHDQYGMLIKQVKQVITHGNMIEVTGLNRYSVDSRTFGPIPLSAVIGKVIWHIAKPRK